MKEDHTLEKEQRYTIYSIEFKEIIIKMLTKLGRKIDECSENFNK